MEQDIYDRPRPVPRWSRYFRGCAIAVSVVCVSLIALLIYLARIPGVQTMATCAQHVSDLGEALRRYHDVNNVYPNRLEDLRKDYLSDPSVLKCPEDKAGKDVTSYVYHKPASDSRGSFVVIECRRHKPIEDGPPAVLKWRLDGKLVTEAEMPSKPKPAGK